MDKADRRCAGEGRDALDSLPTLVAEAIFAHAGEAIVITDAAARIVRVNEAFCAITGYRAEEVLGRTPAILKSGRQDASFYAAMWERLAGAGRWRGEIWNRRKNGEIYPELLDITAVRDVRGQVLYYVGIFSDITRSKADAERIRHLAYFDSLTDLPNRAMLVDRLEQLARHVLRAGELAAVLFLDLDRFKDINDSLGHGAGDELLRVVAARLRAAMRDSDTVARLGGDELVVLAGALGRRREQAVRRATRVADKVLAAVSEPLVLAGRELRVSTSIGIALVPEDGESAEDFLKNADTAMYRAKRAGRARYCFFEPAMNAAARARLELEEELLLALREDRIELRYQPLIDAPSGAPVAAEALVRWRHPGEGLLAPARFLPHAEEGGLVVALGQRVLERACAQMRVWLDAPPHRTFEHVAVNVGARELGHPRFLDRLEAILAASALAPHHLCIEVAEQDLAGERHGTTLARMHALAGLGVRLAVDRFTAGSVSLADLQRLPSPTLKLDRTLIDTLPEARARTRLRAVLALARELALPVVAVGVERAEQLELLRAEGCARAQGYLLGAPGEAARIGARQP